MESPGRKFISTPLGLSRREREGSSLSTSFIKQMVYGHRISKSQSLFKRDLLGHYGCVNAIEFSSDGDFIASGGDDRRFLLWNVGQAIYDVKPPVVFETQHISNINTCCFNAENRKIATGGNDGQVLIHDISVKQSTSIYGLSDAIYALSPDPVSSTIIATASDDGKVRILDTRVPTDSAPFVLADLRAAMHSVTYNPMDPRLLATANSKHGLGLWDIRMPFMSLTYRSGVYNCMSVRFNNQGDRLLALRRRSSPVLFDIAKMQPMFEFDYKTYYNACTLKSCSFAGLQDEYVMSGSDDCSVYLWKIPNDTEDNFTHTEPHMILRGHRSIVNQVRYCPQNQFIISSGVEKLIKVWSPYALPNCTGHLVHNRRYGDDDEVERNAYSHEEYIHMVLQAGSFLSHDYTRGTTEEEPCMIAFFDSLIQREVEHSIELEDSSSSSSSSSGDDHDASREKNGAKVDGRKKKLFQYDSDSSLESPSSSNTRLRDVEAATGTHSPDRQAEASPARQRESESPSSSFYNDLLSSSDSDTEVEEILSAMYSRYMNSRERLMSGESKPSGKKISAIIARGKQKSMSSKKGVFQRRLLRIREDLQHSGDQYLRDSANSIGILVDVIDNFVDNLVTGESGNNRSLSDIRDGLTDSTSNFADAVAVPEDVARQAIVRETDRTLAETPTSRQETQSTSTAISAPPDHLSSQEASMFFMPEFQAFPPESFPAVVSVTFDQSPLDADSTVSKVVGPSLSTVQSKCGNHTRPDPVSSKIKILKCNGGNRDVSLKDGNTPQNRTHTSVTQEDDLTSKPNNAIDSSACSQKISSMSRLGHLRSAVTTSSIFTPITMSQRDATDLETHKVTTPDATPGTSVEVHFKKSKINRKNIRYRHRTDSGSSSEDEER
ncbi:DDB1- and CUL4-associated factor 5 [Biomphalaria pfeifferi]|uniref:DDB1- and CUL4-associated factor 5 n=1 Tax=Biomphalaria pfeifferi TaxID=112525 RepID=A0AAD8F1V7_BIOPF|nr:DDB1- and CUL4-associated factor 5 [Biomphalaria pfeifferi]